LHQALQGYPPLVTDVANTAVESLARWLQRVIPDRQLMKEAIAEAEVQLLPEAQMARD